MTTKMIFIITLITAAVINDLYNYKVRNEITFTFAIIGIAYNIAINGLHDLSSSVLGLIIPLIILFPLYISKMLGAGDIKLFCALGTFIGFRLILSTIAYSFIAGAVIAIAIMLSRKNLVQRFKYFLVYIRCCLLCMAIMPYGDFDAIKDGTKMHFTIPIALGAILTLISL